MNMINKAFSQTYHIRVSPMWDVCVCVCTRESVIDVVYRSDVFRWVITAEKPSKHRKRNE